MNKWKLQAKIADTEIQRLRIRVAEHETARTVLDARVERAEAEVEQLRARLVQADAAVDNQAAVIAALTLRGYATDEPYLANPERVNNGCSIYRSPES